MLAGLPSVASDETYAAYAQNYMQQQQYAGGMHDHEDHNQRSSRKRDRRMEQELLSGNIDAVGEGASRSFQHVGAYNSWDRTAYADRLPFVRFCI